MKFFLVSVFSLSFFIASAQDAVPANIYGFKMPAFNGSTIDLSAYKGKKILIVNTPSDGDNARQYTDLENLSRQYKDKLVVIGILANDFEIEPGSNKEALARRPKNYHVTFPLASKQMVRGKLSPLFTWLTQKKYNHLKDNEVKWDFQKYLIDQNGALVAIFDPKIKADNPALITAIEK